MAPFSCVVSHRGTIAMIAFIPKGREMLWETFYFARRKNKYKEQKEIEREIRRLRGSQRGTATEAGRRCRLAAQSTRVEGTLRPTSHAPMWPCCLRSTGQVLAGTANTDTFFYCTPQCTCSSSTSHVFPAPVPIVLFSEFWPS